MRIIYNNEETKTLSIVIPTNEYKGSMDKLAKKTVPSGIKYKIIENTDLPKDRTFRDAWEYDFDKNGHDGVGG